jgi:hypothetical protein
MDDQISAWGSFSQILNRKTKTLLRIGSLKLLFRGDGQVDPKRWRGGTEYKRINPSKIRTNSI